MYVENCDCHGAARIGITNATNLVNPVKEGNLKRSAAKWSWQLYYLHSPCRKDGLSKVSLCTTVDLTVALFPSLQGL